MSIKIHNFLPVRSLFSGLLCMCLGGAQLPSIATNRLELFAHQTDTTCQPKPEPNFLVVGGGGAPHYNEIALEKNILYFQRTLQTLGYNPASATIFFANGNGGQATIRYIDPDGKQQFKVPEIPYLQGSATVENVFNWFRHTIQQNSNRPIFFYFTGHGFKNPDNVNNNALIMWEEKLLTVQDLSDLLDELPQDIPVVTMMAQCYSGSFANLIYQGGDPNRPVALHTRCGFFATVKTRPSVGCTPEVNEADYKDYSSSFFAALSGRSRTGESVPSADYNRDGQVSYAEAHAFAKVDEQTMDWPVSTSEVWLQKQASEGDMDRILAQPIANFLSTARPEQKYVINSVVKIFGFDPNQSFFDNVDQFPKSKVKTDVEEAYLVRLGMELINISMAQGIRESGNRNAIATLDRLINCEASSLQK